MNINLEELYFVWNGGKGSGNHNPGQGRGVGKPANRNNTYKKMVSSANLTEEEKRYKKYWEDYGGEYIVLAGSNPLDEGYEDEKYEDEKLEDGRTFEQARDYFDSMIRKRKFPEDTTVYRRLQFPTKSDLEKAIKNNFVWDAPQATSSTLNPKFLKDSKINPFKLVEDENCLILKINVKKGQSGLALDNSMEEIILPRYSEFKIKKEDEKIDGITTYVVDYVEHTTKENLNSLSFQVNGGPNSGNHNPGQGRGVGKPANKVRKTIFTKDSSKSELNSKIMEIVSKSRLERSKILNGAKTPQDFKFGLADENSLKATKEQLDKINELDEKTKEEIGDLNVEFYKAKDNYTEPGFYKDSSGNVYEVVKEWGTVDSYSSDEYQKMYPIDSDRNRENEFFVSKYDKLEKISKVDAYMSLREGYTFGGLSSKEKNTIKSYTYATPQNSELRKGTKIEEIPSAMILQNVINRTKSEPGTYYRGIRTEEGAKSLLNLKKGDIYVDKGFMSTDRSKDVAKKFATSKIMIEVNSKGGMGKSLSVSEFSMHPEENEVLFNAGTNMKIKDIIKDGEYTIYKMEVL